MRPTTPRTATCSLMLVLTSKVGALANRLWLMAHLVATGLENNVPVAYPAFDEYADQFGLTAGNLLCRFPPASQCRTLSPVARRASWQAVRALGAVGARLHLNNRLVRVHRLADGCACDLGSDEFTALSRTRLLLMDGWLYRHEGALRKHADQIRKLLLPVPRIRAEGEAAVSSARGEGPLVGVHVRRGDYRTFLGGRYFFPVDAYARWMRAVAVAHQAGVSFLVTGDDAEAVANLASNFRGAHASRLAPVADLWALSRCDYIIGPPSTFSSWASFAGRVPLLHLTAAEDVPDLQRARPA